MPRIRLTTRRSMALVSGASILMAGLRGGPQPGWHYRLGGVEVGACRNDGFGRAGDDHGVVFGCPYQVGAWAAARPGDRSGAMRLGLRVRGGIATAWSWRGGCVVW
jgi:hypothetical protein